MTKLISFDVTVISCNVGPCTATVMGDGYVMVKVAGWESGTDEAYGEAILVDKSVSAECS